MIFQKKKKKNSYKFKLPRNFQHLAIIMDGNGRWAKQRGWPRYFGHFKGVKALRSIIKAGSKIGIPYLTAFTFSTENWKRSSLEVSVIMKLIKRSLLKYEKDFYQHQVRLHILGDLDPLPSFVQDIFQKITDKTKNHQGLQLILAVNYGGKREILKAIKTCHQDIKKNQLDIKSLTEEKFRSYLSSSLFPPPDMIIRTGGVSRLSNFYLWSGAYSEIYISQVLWPDFNTEELIKALKKYSHTDRKFGAITD